jgi:hypothetical protein
VPAWTASSAARSSPACWYRFAGSFSRHRAMTAAKSAGTWEVSGRGGWLTMADIKSTPLRP